MKEKSKIIDYVSNTENPYMLKMDNMNIEMIYSENNKTFKDCMKNILKNRKIESNM